MTANSTLLKTVLGGFTENREARRVIDQDAKLMTGLGKAISDAAVARQELELETNQRTAAPWGDPACHVALLDGACLLTPTLC